MIWSEIGDGFSHSMTALVIYQDEAARAQVERVFDHLLEGPLDGTGIQMVWVRLSRLVEREEVRRDLLEPARAAALIVFSVSLCVELPDHLKRWIESWAPAKREQASALVMMGHPHRETARPGTGIIDYLKEIARRGGMDFLSRRPECAPAPRTPSEARFSGVITPPDPSIDEFPNLSPRPWPGGLNE